MGGGRNATRTGRGYATTGNTTNATNSTTTTGQEAGDAKGKGSFGC